MIGHHFSAIVGWIKTAVGWVGNLIHQIFRLIQWIGRIHLPGTGWVGGAAHFLTHPHLQHGGDVRRSGMFTVGEKGPEAIFLPSGSAVRPMPRVTPWETGVAGGGGTLRARQPIIIELNKKKVGEAIAEFTLDKAGLAGKSGR